jgi:undecaprenyl diphosphate synthase
VCICNNSKHEIFDAVESLAQKHALGEVKDINKGTFEKELYGGTNVKPDILIRTSNEVRLSNFMLYQTDDS